MFCPLPWLAFRGQVVGCCSIYLFFRVQTVQSVSGVKSALVGLFKNDKNTFPKILAPLTMKKRQNLMITSQIWDLLPLCKIYLWQQ